MSHANQKYSINPEFLAAIQESRDAALSSLSVERRAHTETSARLAHAVDEWHLAKDKIFRLVDDLEQMTKQRDAWQEMQHGTSRDLERMKKERDEALATLKGKNPGQSLEAHDRLMKLMSDGYADRWKETDKKLAAAQVEIVALRQIAGSNPGIRPQAIGPYGTTYAGGLGSTVAQPLLDAIAKVATEAELYRTGREKGYGDLSKAIAALAPWVVKS